MGFLGAFLDAQASGQRYQQNQDELALRRRDLEQRQQYQNSLLEDRKLARVMDILKLGGRPVNDNSVNYQMDAPARLAGVPGFMPEIQVSRPAIPGQTVTANGSQFEMPTLDDLMGRERMQKQRLGEMDLGFYTQKQRIDDISKLDSAMRLLDYKQNVERQSVAEQPTIDPRNPLATGPIPINQAGGAAALLRLLLPDWKMSTNYNTGTPSFHAVDPVTQKPIGVTDPSWRGSALPRPRQNVGNGKSGGTAKFNKIESLKQMALQNAEEDFNKHGDPEKLEAAKTKAQRDYETAIVRAGGSVKPRQQAPASSGSAPTAINRKTGQRMVLKDGKWQPL